MTGKLTKKQVRQEAKQVEKQELIAAKRKVPNLIERLQNEKKLTIQDITDHLNEKLKEIILDYKIKTKSAIDKWVQKENDSNKENDPSQESDPNNKKVKSAPNNKEVKIVVSVLNELLGPSIQGIPEEYETYRKAMEQVFLSGIIDAPPPDLEDFWKEQYNNTFRLYNWPNTFSILKAAELRRELESLDYSFPKHTGLYSQIALLIPIAKEIEGDRGSCLAYGFNYKGKDLGLYLWNSNGYFEYPVFIANSVNNLIDHHIITLEKEHNLHFDREKYLSELFEANMRGFILRLNIDSNDIKTHLKRLEVLYESAFKMLNRGTIKFETTGKTITVTIENGDFKKITYNINNGNLLLFIEKLNDELNGIDKPNFCRPKYYGYYLINEKYLAYLRLDIATDLIQKGYISSRFKMLPKLAFYNPKKSNLFNEFQALAEIEKNQNLIWIDEDPETKGH